MDTKKQYILRVRFDVTIPGFEPIELIQDHPLSCPRQDLLFFIRMNVGTGWKSREHIAWKTTEISPKEILVTELKKTPAGGLECQRLFYWLRGNEAMPVYDHSKMKTYFNKFMAKGHTFQATNIPPQTNS